MKTKLVWFSFLKLFIFCTIQISGQNLVPNPSFEDTLWCPYNDGQINAAKHWFSPWGGGGSSELFHECNNYPHPPWSTGIVGVPKNPPGFQYARTGIAYAGFIFFIDGGETRENIAVQLTNGLNPTRTYYVEYYVSLSNRASWGITNVGAYFSRTMFTYAGHHPYVMNLTPQIEYSGPPIIDTLNWVKVSGYFKPQEDGVKYMVIGNFADSGQTIYTTLDSIGFSAYYYVDDVMVVDSASYVNSLIQFPDSYRDRNEKLVIFPNPVNEVFTIENKTNEGIKSVVIYNLQGIEVERVIPKLFEPVIQINTRELKEGIYFVGVLFKNGERIIKKVVVIH